MSIIEQIGNEFRRGMNRHLMTPFRRWLLSREVRWVGGQFPSNLGPQDLVTLAVVRDAEIHIESFVDHHLRLGAKHIVLLDNGSRDASLAIALEQNHVTVLRTSKPFARYHQIMRQFLVDYFGRNCWSLVADIDERFDFPASHCISLAELLNYLNKHRFTAVAAQMLDLFADGPVGSWPTEGGQLMKECCWYDVGNITADKLRRGQNLYSNAQIVRLRGGIRGARFGSTCAPCLTKFPLLFRSGGARPSRHSPHECRRAYVADVSCVLLHYKFHRGFLRQCKEAVNRKCYFQQSSEYRQYLSALRDNPDLVLRTPEARRYSGVDALVEDNFLVVSRPYQDFVHNHRRSRSGAAA